MSILLGIYLRHDASVAVSINGKVKYRKAERYTGVKHANAGLKFVFDTLREWGITKVDFCAYCPDNKNGIDTCQDTELFNKGKIADMFPNSFCVDHHYAHILSAWPIVDTDTVNYGVCVDGKGDKDKSTTVIQSPASNPKILKIDRFPHMGFEFYALGDLLKFKGLEFDIAGKLMGLQAYPEECFSDFGLKQLKDIDLSSLPSCKLGARHTNLKEWHDYWWKYIDSLFTFEKDDNVVYAGGCAQNSVYNYNLKKKFKNLHIPPHCYDGGLSLGCLEFLRIKLNQPKFDTTGFPYWQDDEIQETPSIETIKRAAELIARGKIVGWMQGRGELGPRALGNRSILMSADKASNKDVINSKVKFREPWRPYAGSVLKEKALNFFDMAESKHMLYASYVTSGDIPAVTHVDGTCRMQTVESGPFYDLIAEYEKLTGLPVILNTSMNLMGKPITSFKWDAMSLFNRTAMDAIIVGNEIERKCKKFL